ncbi:hypothetical protein GPJ56_007086 [Histomonas meleagridis]|uniref:uncharacterized protein n=1 Tax=Histomonas meleagridis TaxID=135588 RepID=UPI00355A6845|nr:hypothetical protein GPJ56_007086 [Histomonas meleagridis]KAH0799799.1 hypothetical protein GO595_007520 [Histomonas meleagridis]
MLVLLFIHALNINYCNNRYNNEEHDAKDEENSYAACAICLAQQIAIYGQTLGPIYALNNCPSLCKNSNDEDEMDYDYSDEFPNQDLKKGPPGDNRFLQIGHKTYESCMDECFSERKGSCKDICQNYPKSKYVNDASNEASCFYFYYGKGYPFETIHRICGNSEESESNGRGECAACYSYYINTKGRLLGSYAADLYCGPFCSNSNYISPKCSSCIVNAILENPKLSNSEAAKICRRSCPELNSDEDELAINTVSDMTNFSQCLVDHVRKYGPYQGVIIAKEVCGKRFLRQRNDEEDEDEVEPIDVPEGVSNFAACTVCKTVVNGVKALLEGKAATAMNAKKLCEKVPAQLKEVCETIVGHHLNVVMRYAQKGMSATEACNRIGLC